MTTASFLVSVAASVLAGCFKVTLEVKVIELFTPVVGVASKLTSLREALVSVKVTF
jgi:hypothetical protein